MSDQPHEEPLTDPARKLPASPESSDTAEPPGSGSLEAESRISLEPVAEVTVAKTEGEEPREP